jgi:hypothetical protein
MMRRIAPDLRGDLVLREGDWQFDSSPRGHDEPGTQRPIDRIEKRPADFVAG